MRWEGGGGGTPGDKVGGRWKNGYVGVSEKSKILSNVFIWSSYLKIIRLKSTWKKFK